MDTPFRLIIIGQLLLIAIVVIVRGPRSISVPLALLKLSIAAFMIESSPVLSAAIGPVQLPLFFLTSASPYLIWMCAYALFNFEKPPIWVMVMLPAVTFTFCGYHTLAIDAPDALKAMSIAVSIATVLHAVYSTFRGGIDDLSQPRRRFRLCFVGCISAIAVIVLGLELAYVGQPEPVWVGVLIVGMIQAAVLLIGVPLLARPDDLSPDEPALAQTPVDSGLDKAEQEMHSSLVQAMDNRAYARTGLTIRQLAEELQLPEHQLRVLINTRLGYKNFSTFLNGYRIKETCKRLQDPKEARVSILTIALDAGFASLAPFNRAFRQFQDMTPSEYRREQLKPDSNVTVLHS